MITPAMVPLKLILSLTAILAHSLVVAQSIYPSNSKWSYYGCFNETTPLNNTGNRRALDGTTEDLRTNMTVPICQQFCADNSYNFAGLEYTSECYCGFSVNSLAARVQDSECNLACVGNNTQFCGGALRLSIYNATHPSAKSTAAKGIGGGKANLGSILALGVAVCGSLWLA